MTSGPAKLLVLPGFLGTRRDFDAWIDGLRAAMTERGAPAFVDVKVMAVCQDAGLAPSGSWSDWNRKAAREIEDWKGPSPVFAVGYSLGGRLLLSLSETNPELFAKLVFLSVNPGLRDPGAKGLSDAEAALAARDRLLRRQNDEAWARRFFESPWEDLIRDWQSQPVFRDSVHEPERLEADYDRAVLARVLTVFSLADQPDFRLCIRAAKTPQLWLAGERDVKFAAIVQELVDGGRDSLWGGFVPKASHRVFLDNPRFTFRRAAEFFQPS